MHFYLREMCGWRPNQACTSWICRRPLHLALFQQTAPRRRAPERSVAFGDADCSLICILAGYGRFCHIGSRLFPCFCFPLENDLTRACIRLQISFFLCLLTFRCENIAVT